MISLHGNLAVFTADYLALTKTFVYRQLSAALPFRPLIFCEKVINAERFPVGRRLLVGRETLGRGERGRLARKYGTENDDFLLRRANELLWTRRLGGMERPLLHAHFGTGGVRALPLAVSTGSRLIVSFHGNDCSRALRDPLYRKLLKILFPWTERVLTANRLFGRRLEALGCPPEKIETLHYGVDVEDIAERDPQRDDGRTLLQVSGLHPKKGLDLTVRAFAALSERNPELRLVIVGEGPLRSSLEELAAELGVGGGVTFTGSIPVGEVFGRLGEASVFVHPSRTDEEGAQEGIPNSLIEAMAKGLPVVSTFHSGIPELVENGKDGLLVPEGDHGALAEAVGALLEDRSRRVALGRRARKKVEARFNLRVQNEKLVGIYREVVSGPKERYPA